MESQVKPIHNRRVVTTVLGERLPEELGITDAHNHVWIERVPDTPDGLPRLEQQQAILQELVDYRLSGGRAIVDCQPGGCGRNGLVLEQLARKSGVQIVACTGFHLPQYYPADHWLFQANAGQAQEYFVSEMRRGLSETLARPEPVKAGFIKVACGAGLEATPQPLLEGAADASLRTGAMIEIHTEKGSAAQEIARFFLDYGLEADRVVICHVDKRADIGLHRELAQTGIVLEYDTFYRAKYEPEKNLWPLLEQMVSDGLASHIALATDMAEAKLWSRLRGGPGLAGFVTRIRPRLYDLGMDDLTVHGLLGGNIACCLARPGDVGN